MHMLGIYVNLCEIHGQWPWPKAMAKSRVRLAQTKTFFFSHKNYLFRNILQIVNICNILLPRPPHVSANIKVYL